MIREEAEKLGEATTGCAGPLLSAVLVGFNNKGVLGAVLRHTTVNISFAGILLLFLLLGSFVAFVAGLTNDDSQLTSGVASHSDEQLPLPKVELAQEDAFAGRKCLYGESPETSKLRRCKLSLRI